MNIDWSTAPEGATHHATMRGINKGVTYWLNDNGYWVDGDWYEFDAEFDGGENFGRDDFEEVTERPTKPIDMSTCFDLMFYGCQSINAHQAIEILSAIKAEKVRGVKWVGE